MLFHKINLRNIPEIIFAHRYSCPGYKYHFKPMMPNIEITYVESGAITILFDGQEITAEEGSFLILSHRYEYDLRTGQNQNHIHYTVSANIDSESGMHERCMPLTDGILVPMCLPACHESEGLLKILNLIISEHNKPDDVSRYKEGALVIQLLCDIAGAAKRQSEGCENSITDILDSRIKKYLDKSIAQKITLGDVAESIGKTANYLNQVFMQKNKVPIIRYLNTIRIKKAAELIMNEDMPLKSVAASVGISDQNYLSRLFKQVMGMTISEYRLHSADYTFPLTDHSKIF